MIVFVGPGVGHLTDLVLPGKQLCPVRVVFVHLIFIPN